jgi:bifunctional DNA-binding transcriptional regulator/antitoxin component of YhaV-PrlF toxin-antitoxin module
MSLSKKVLSLTRLSEKGQLTIPAEYRRTHQLERDSALVLVEIGDALVLVPHDEALASVTARLEAALKGAGAGSDDLIAAATKARAEIVREEFGDDAGREAR